MRVMRLPETSAHISRIENGYGGIDGDLYVKLCTWLGVSFDTFVVEAALDPAA